MSATESELSEAPSPLSRLLAGGGARTAGTALILIVVVIVFLSILATSVHSVNLVKVKATRDRIQRNQAQLIAKSGFQYGVLKLWDEYLTDNGGVAGSHAHYRSHLEDTFHLADGAEIELQADDWPEFSTGDLVSVTVTRRDNGTSTDLVISAVGRADGPPVTLRGIYTVEGAEYNGFKYALFSKNINCIFCHAKVDNVQRFKGGPYERVKVASLESLLLREGSANSTIAGTIYTQGNVLDKSGNLLDLGNMKDGTLSSYEFDSSGMIVVDPIDGSKTLTDLSPAVPDADGNLLPFQNAYVDYPADAAGQVDGPLPSVFPPVFPDLNANRKIDDDEYQSVASEADGYIQGGVLYNVATGSIYSGESAPTSGNITEVDGSIGGNLILHGTPDNPIEISGDVAIDGDVIISGTVKGDGAIYARGNVYVVGDVTYADGSDILGNRTFGVASDGTTNSLGLAAGQNIMVGDYLTSKGGDIDNVSDLTVGDGTGDFSFALSEIALFNRGEWQKTQPMLPGPDGTLVPNSTYVDGYVPRYYTQSPGQPIAIFLPSDSKKNKIYWDPNKETWIGKEHPGDWDGVKLLTDPGNAVVSSLAPAANWISQTLLKKLWIDERAGRESGTPLTFDGLLYSNNAIFTLARKRANTDGKLRINGGLVAADTGVLAAGGLELNYDEEVAGNIDLKTFDSVKLSQKLFPTTLAH